MYPGGAWLKDSTIQPNSVGLFGSKNIHPDLLLSWMIKKKHFISLCHFVHLDVLKTLKLSIQLAMLAQVLFIYGQQANSYRSKAQE